MGICRHCSSALAAQQGEAETGHALEHLLAEDTSPSKGSSRASIGKAPKELIASTNNRRPAARSLRRWPPAG